MPATHGNGCTLRKTFIKQSATFESYRSVKAIFSYSIFQYAGGLRLTTMKIAGMVPSMRNMMKWPKH